MRRLATTTTSLPLNFFSLAHQPLLDLVESLEQAEGHLDDDGGAAVADRDFLRAVDVEVLQLSLELVVGRLEVEQRLRGGTRGNAKRVSLGRSEVADAALTMMVRPSSRRKPPYARRSTRNAARQSKHDACECPCARARAYAPARASTGAKTLAADSLWCGFFARALRVKP